MEVLVVKPKNKAELDFLTNFFERANIDSELQEAEVVYQKKTKKKKKQKGKNIGQH